MNLRRRPVQREAVEFKLDGALGLDAAAVMEKTLRRSVADEKARRWREDNAEAIRLSNKQLDRDGLWCDAYRLF